MSASPRLVHISATLLLALLLSLPASLAAGRGIASGHVPRILVLLSYDPSFPTSGDILTGLDSALPRGQFELMPQYMNTKRLPGPEHMGVFRALLAWELAHSPAPDLVMTFDDNALHFVMDNRASLFARLPIVFAGVNDRDFADSVEREAGITGVIEAVSMEETVSLMRQLFGHSPTLGVIVDSTETARADLATLKALDLHIPLAVYDLSALPEANFLENLRQVSPTQAILLLSAYSGHGGKTYSFYESLALIRQASNAPIFHLWKHGLGQGIFGGKLVSHYEQAIRAAGLAKKILTGTPADDVPVIRNSPNVYLFDWNELRRFGIPLESLPASAQILNRPLSLQESHPDIFWGIIVAAVAAAGLISALALIAYYRYRAGRRLAHHLGFLNRLIQAIETPIYLKNDRAEYEMVNSSFARLTRREPEGLIGKQATDIFDSRTANALDDQGDRIPSEQAPLNAEIDLDLQGDRRIFRVSRVALKNEDGGALILGSMQDITADRLLAEQLRTENQRLESMVAKRTKQLERANAILTAMAETDRLTKLANRRKIDAVLKEEFKLAQRYQGFSLIMLDIDHFKAVNDRYGHPAGDTVLQGMAALLRTHCRATDLVGRWGGEEFLIICRNTIQEGALDLARKLRQHVEEASFLPGQSVSASFGVTALIKGEALAMVLQRVDKLMYQAKQKGRNRVESELSATPAES